MELLERLEPSPERARRRVDVSVKWGHACVYQPSPDRLAVLQDSYDRAVTIGYDAGARSVLYWITWIEHAIGAHDAAFEHSARCLELVAPLGDEAMVARLTFNLGQDSYHRAEYARAREYLERAMELRRACSRRGGTTVQASALGYLGMLDVERGDYATAYERIHEALGLVRNAG